MELTCEKCGTENPSNVKFCKQCGNQLILVEAGETAVSDPTPPTYNPIALAGSEYKSPAPTNSGKRYSTLRTISAICRIMGYVFGGLGVLSAIFGGIAVLNNPYLRYFSPVFSAFGVFIGTLIWAAVVFVFWLIIAESISVVLDIEANTRRTAQLLEKQGN